MGKADDLPDTCKDMLKGMVEDSLTVLASDRHAFQTQGVKMIGQAMQGVHKQMVNSVSQAQAKVDNADREKGQRANALDAATKSLANLEAGANAAKGAADDAKAGLSAAKANVVSAAAAVETHDKDMVAAAELSKKVASALSEVFEPAKTAKASAKSAHVLEKTLRGLVETGLVEGGVVDHLVDALTTAPEARGTFDGLVMDAVGKQTAKYTAQSEKDAQNGERKKGDLANAKVNADAALAAAEGKLTGSTEALAAAEAALKDGKANLKAAQAAVSSYERDMKDAASTLEDAKAALESFTEGAQKSFAALVALAPPPEPEPVPQATETPAAAPPAPAPAAA